MGSKVKVTQNILNTVKAKSVLRIFGHTAAPMEILSTRYFVIQEPLKGFQLDMRQSSNSNSTTFDISTDSKFDECFKRFVVECEFMEKSLFYYRFHMHREPHSAEKPFF